MSNKLQAFARVPRSGKVPARRNDLVRIDANFMERMNHAAMNQDLSTIMTKTETKLSIEINAQANIGYALKDNRGKVVADKQDIMRIQNLGAAITKERKAALGDEVTQQTKYTLAAFVQKGEELERPITRFHKSFLAVYRFVNAQYQTVAKNNQAIEAFVCSNEGQTKAKTALVEMARRTSIAVGKYLYHRANLREDEVPAKINSYLFDEHVPIYIYSKLSGALIGTSVSGFDIRTILFPKDPTKGLTLTFKEIRDVGFTNDLMKLASGSNLVVKMARNDILVRLMINLPEGTDLNPGEANPLGQKLASVPFSMLPYEGAVETSETYGFLAKNGVRGVAWASGSILTPVDLLKYYGTIAKRMYYCLLLRPSLKGALLADMFEGFEYDQSNDKLDIYDQLKAWSVQPGSANEWFTMFASQTEMYVRRELIKKVFIDVTMVGQGHAIATSFLELFNGTNDITIRDGATNIGTLIFTEVKNLAVTMRQSAANPNVVIGDRISLVSGKKKMGKDMKSGIQERSTLSATAANVIVALDRRGYRSLAQRMRTWFRLFLDETIQDAVASIFLARLEAFLEVPLEVTREERGAFMEPDDPDDLEEDEDVTIQPEAPVVEPVNPDEV